jgi:hypothetical protein
VPLSFFLLFYCSKSSRSILNKDDSNGHLSHS